MLPDCLSQETALRQYGQEMWAESFKQGFGQGVRQGRLKAVRSLLDKGKITEEIAARETGMSVEAFRKAAAYPEQCF